MYDLLSDNLGRATICYPLSSSLDNIMSKETTTNC